MIFDVVEEGNVIALYSPANVQELFYLCKVISCCIAEVDVKDAHNHAVLKGSKYFKCRYYEKLNEKRDFLIPYTKFVNRMCSEDKISLSVINRDNILYVNKEKGAEIAVKFVKGPCQLGFGKIMNQKTKCFKRYHPYDIDCPDKENLESKWRNLKLHLHLIWPKN